MAGDHKHWWQSSPDVVPCRLCQCPIQRTLHGNLSEAMTKHLDTVHPGHGKTLASTSGDAS
jgi:hypothetical protein